jgi:WD40-like Beta Propeller Repeat
MISRAVVAAGIAVLMVVSSVGTYMYLGSRQSKVAAPAQLPGSATPSPSAFDMPGTLFVTQAGAIYSFSAGRFHQLTPVGAGWTQLAPYPGGKLLAVKRLLLYSDVYIIDRFGKVLKQLTHNTAAAGNFDPSARHWSFYPRLSYNKKSIFMSYDKPKFGFDVPMSIWSMPVGGSIGQGRLWSNAIDYTGGDIQPLPLRSGIIYTKYSYGPDCSGLESQLWFTSAPEAAFGGQVCYPPAGAGHGRPLTSASEGCAQPSLSPDGKTIAMICTHKTQVSYLELASWNGKTLGPRRIIVTNQLVAQPTWAPDGTGIAYLAPSVLGSGFQLWFLPKAAYTPPTPSPSPASPSPTPGVTPNPSPSPSPSPTGPPVVTKPLLMTSNLGLDATSPIVWLS